MMNLLQEVILPLSLLMLKLILNNHLKINFRFSIECQQIKNTYL